VYRRPLDVPISRQEFDRSRTPDSWEAVIEGFLNSHPTEAFGVREVAAAVQYPLGLVMGAHGLHEILHRMAEQGKIQERLVRAGRKAETFYASLN
jgi:hypothetical protein